jgi:hypothetical protein
MPNGLANLVQRNELQHFEPPNARFADDLNLSL